MPMTHRENYLRAASFKEPETIPVGLYPSGAYWLQQREALEDLCARHPAVWPNFKKGSVNYESFKKKETRRVDAWGCTWEYEIDGLEGVVHGFAIDDWARFDGYKAPEPLDTSAEALEKFKAEMLKARQEGRFAGLSLNDHGFFFLRLTYLRGFENFMMDAAAEEPRLDELVEMVTRHYEVGALPRIGTGLLDILYAADDLGTQNQSMLGPRLFRRWIMPGYKRLFLPARKAGAHVYLHTDGYVLDIAEELLECGVSIINVQDLANGIDNLARTFKDRIAIDLDVDRQKILPFGTPKEVRELVKEEVMKLGSPQGGLMFTVGIYPGTPLANVEALACAFEEFRTYWVGR